MARKQPKTQRKRPASRPVLPVEAIRSDLLHWYSVHRRRLPWRAEPTELPDPYHTLVSEAMLQQTQVATVVDYFNRFIAELPTVTALAEADEQRVLSLWQGLGYYRRARNLHAAARAIVERHEGRVPATVEELLALPGVGRYTAGAIASIGHGTRAAIVDGNVARVVARWAGVREAIDDKPTRELLWSLAEELVPEAHPGDFNQAMMELGATHCSPRQPQCASCPVSRHCEAHLKNATDQIPARAARKSPRSVGHHVIALRDATGKWLLRQRPETGLWSKMWELPTAEDLRCDDESGLLASLRDWVLSETGLVVTMPVRVESFTHQTTHKTITFTLWSATRTSGRLRSSAGRWVAFDDVSKLPLSNPQRRAMKILSNEPGTTDTISHGRTTTLQ
jgi:A/G-specific adenine glycosylase